MKAETEVGFTLAWGEFSFLPGKPGSRLAITVMHPPFSNRAGVRRRTRLQTAQPWHPARRVRRPAAQIPRVNPL